LRGNHPICQNGLLTDLGKSRTTSVAELAQINAIIIDLPIQMPQKRQRRGDGAWFSRLELGQMQNRQLCTDLASIFAAAYH